MSIFYLDLVNGNDTNDGTSWAQAWKTFTNGPTAVRVTAGDEIRVAKSPDPVSIGNASFTNASRLITLSTAQNTTITNCEANWTAIAGGDCTPTLIGVATDAKEGSNCVRLTFDSSIQSSTNQAYFATGLLDLSGYQKISFWIKNSSALATAGRLIVNLCSNADGTGVVDSFEVPAIPSANQWVPLTLTKIGGGNLGNSIQSIMISTGAAPTNSSNYLIDNFIACTSDGLNLQSIISKSSHALPSNDGWYAIKSIDGININLDSINQSKSDSGAGYYGATETVTAYKRETIKTTTMASSSSASLQNIVSFGAPDNYLYFNCGFDTSNSEQNGETFFDALNGYGVCLNNSLATTSFIKINRFSPVRGNVGLGFGTPGERYWHIISTNIISCSSCFSGLFSLIKLDDCICCSCSTLGSTVVASDVGNMKFISMIGTSSTQLYVAGEKSKINSITWSNNIRPLGVVNNGFVIKTLNVNITSNSLPESYGGYILYVAGSGFIENVNISGADDSIMVGISGEKFLSVKNINSVLSNKFFTQGIIGESRNSTMVNGSGKELFIRTVNSDIIRLSSFPLKYSLAKIAVHANKVVSFKAWVKKGHPTGISTSLLLPGGSIAGIDNDVISIKGDDTNEEELSLNFTPTEPGVVEIFLTVGLNPQSVNYGVVFSDGGSDAVLGTKVGHNLTTGDIVSLSGLTQSYANKDWTVTVINADTFTLDSASWTLFNGADVTGDMARNSYVLIDNLTISQAD